jgi:hypothetical protein
LFATNMPNPLLWVQNSCLGVVSRNFVVVRHPFRKWVLGCIQSTSFCHRNNLAVFRKETCPLNYFSSKTHVLGGFAQFRCRTSPIPKTGVGLHKSTSFCHRNHFFVFRNEHAQSITLGPKLIFGVVSRNFIAARHPFRKQVYGCIQSTSFCHRNNFIVFRKETCPLNYFSSKTHVWVVSRNFVAAHHPL